MTDAPQPEAVWVFPEQKRSRRRIWLIVGSAVAAVAIAGVLLFLFLPREGAPAPVDSPSPSVPSTAIPSPLPSDPSTPQTTPPAVVDPDLETFAGLVKPVLDDAVTGLSMASDMSGQDATVIVEQLQQDAERLSDAVAPSGISDEWQSAVSAYAERLVELNDAYQDDSGTDSAMDAAEASLQDVRDLVGL